MDGKSYFVIALGDSSISCFFEMFIFNSMMVDQFDDDCLFQMMRCALVYVFD